MTMPDRPTARVIRAAEADAWQDGFALLAAARAEAQALRDTVQAELAAARAEGRTTGRQQGEAEAAALLLQTQAQVDAYLAAMQPRIADLALQIVREVLDESDDADLIARATRRALAGFRESEGVTLSVPAPLLTEVETRLADTPLRIVADRHLTGRQCVLTSPVSSIDISLDSQLDAIRMAMAAT